MRLASILATFLAAGVLVTSVERAIAATDLEHCADERVKTALLPAATLTAAEAACARVIAETASAEERQKAHFFRGLMRFLKVVQSGSEQATKRDGSVAYSLPSQAELSAALADIQAAIDGEGPMKADALALRVTVNQMLGREAEARGDLEEAMQQAPSNPTPFVQRALDRQRSGDIAAAMEDLDKAIALDPKAGTALWSRGDLQRRLGMLVGARDDLAAAAALGPPFRRLALSQKSEVELRSGNVRAAYDDMLAAARERSDLPKEAGAIASAELLVRAGDLALDKLKEVDEAEKLYGQAQRLAPRIWSGALGLARVEETRGQKAKAATIYRRVLAETRSQPRLYERLLASFRLRQLTQPPRRAMAPFRSGLDSGVASGAGSPDGLRRIAFVIGSGDYTQLPSLPNARRDAAVVANALADIGFDVIEIAENLTKAELRAVPAVIAAQAAQADVALVYYAGHGVETGGVNYIVPVDAGLDSDAELQADALALTALTAAAQKARKGAFVIVDACRDDPFVEARMVANSRSAGAARQTAPKRTRNGLAATPAPAANSVVLHSTQPGQTALDGDGLESPFLRGLLETLTTPGMALDAVVKGTTEKVAGSTQGRQVPAAYGAAPAVALLPLAPKR